MKLKSIFVGFVVLFLAVVMAQSRSMQQQQGGMMCGGMGTGMASGSPMTKRAEIRVMPMKLFDQDNADIARLRQIVEELQANRQRTKVADPTIKHQFDLEDQLADLLKAHLERVTTDQGKSERAIAVQARLNQMEGKMMCGACHGGGRMMGAATAGE
jgi:hypothetical protein